MVVENLNKRDFFAAQVMAGGLHQKAAKPNAAQKAHDAAQLAASNRDCPRAGLRGYDPQIARQIAWGE